MFALRYFANRFFPNRFFPHVGAAATPASNGILVLDTRRMPVLFEQVSHPLLYDRTDYPVQADDRDLKPTFTGATAPVIYQ